MKKNGKELIHTLLKIIYKIMEMEEKIQNYGTDVKISISEIHILDTVISNPGIHISGIAKKRGVTRGAISQLVKKMEKKGLLSKLPDPENLSRLMINLTKKGIIAQRTHNELHKLFNRMIEESLKSMSEEEKSSIEKFLGDVFLTTLKLEEKTKIIKE